MAEEMVFGVGSVPVAVAARVYGKDPAWVRAGIISGWLPIGKATRNGRIVTDIQEMDSRLGRINFYRMLAMNGKTQNPPMVPYQRQPRGLAIRYRYDWYVAKYISFELATEKVRACGNAGSYFFRIKVTKICDILLVMEREENNGVHRMGN